ncbi:hypothetical protein BZZ01_14140 [Nostocales cyanobacterium HT-58-2]|nr:hypothetical protein BZZ01_14140 [Nostocales cyanobacterium HT-58-2]
MWWKHNHITFLLLLLLSCLTILCLWFPVDDSNCNAEAIFKSTSQKYEVSAIKVVVQPWRGEHHVYGIFIVPDKYKEPPFFVLTVKGAGSYCEKPFGTLQDIDGISAEPGTHLIRDYIRTRTALRLIFQGLYNQLKDPQNWKLTYPDSPVLF